MQQVVHAEINEEGKSWCEVDIMQNVASTSLWDGTTCIECLNAGIENGIPGAKQQHKRLKEQQMKQKPEQEQILNEQGLPFGLLSKTMQEQMKAEVEKGATIEYFNGAGKWEKANGFYTWCKASTYRVIKLKYFQRDNFIGITQLKNKETGNLYCFNFCKDEAWFINESGEAWHYTYQHLPELFTLPNDCTLYLKNS